jgi:hypothetical protein
MFAGRHFNRSVILLCVRWYLAYNLSLRDLEELIHNPSLGRALLAAAARTVQPSQATRHS